MIFDNAKSERIKKYAQLQTRKGREKYGLILVEGAGPVGLVLKHFPELVIEVLYKNEAPLAESHDIKHVKCTDVVLNAITKDHKGVIAIVKSRIVPRDIDKDKRDLDIIVICKATSDPANSGAIVRACSAFGVSKIIFTDNSVDHWSPKVVRGSAGGVFLLPIMSVQHLSDAIKYVKGLGYHVVATDGYGTDKMPAQNIVETAKTLQHKKVALVFGNEANGLDTSEIEEADMCVKIDINNRMESLNLSATVHIFLYEFNRL